MPMKRELFRLQKRLEQIQGELFDMKAILNEYFSEEEQVILKYEASIGRNGTRLEEITAKELSLYAVDCQNYLRFGEEVEDCLERRLPQTTAVRVGAVPDILKEMGCGNMELYITQKCLRNILHASLKSTSHYHNIELRQLKQLPELLNKPLAVLSTKSHPGTITVILDAQDKEKNQLIVPIKINGSAFYQEEKVEANFILSFYGKRNVEHYIRMAELKNEILFLDKKISTVPGRKPLQLWQFLNANAYINNVQQSEEKVNELGGISEEIKDNLKENKGVLKSEEIPRKGL